jgi:hypothetical protein
MKAGAESIPGKLGRQELARLVEAGEIETVLAVFPDFYGRLLGKRFVGRFFVESVAAHGFQRERRAQIPCQAEATVGGPS